MPATTAISRFTAAAYWAALVCCLTCLTAPRLVWSAAPEANTPAAAPAFSVGFASKDITPQAPVPMWGYADRHAALSQGTMDPLYAKAIVIEAGGDKLALVGTDIGRGPTIPMMTKIREALKPLGIEHVIISGSHSHHGPVIELTNNPGRGKGTFDASVAYAEKLPDLLVEVIREADAARKPAKLGLGTRMHSLNRNRHTKQANRVTDPVLGVLRFDDLDGKLLGLIVNFAAHPVMIDSKVLSFSADYPGHMKRKVESALGGQCVFMQGAAGDLSPNPPAGVNGPEQFGQALGDVVIDVARSIETAVPQKPSIKGRVDHFLFGSRIDFRNKLLMMVYARAFFPELAQAFADEWAGGVQTESNTVLLNGELAMVSGSGEFFSNHANRLRERAYVKHAFFFGYANGHNLYFPTIEAASEGGYGASPEMSPVELGAGEKVMNQSLLNLYEMLGKITIEPKMKARQPDAAATSGDQAGN
ncbi:MAG: neutral/alkaline non-lysosomal ceramidase N-terminal domain-containing protein [Pirellulales bacterium]|nr:neutral/alkaline non-lysosomal ceramidase N-terminal domain-containing protein [Pirellulales bacterium]